MKNNRKFLLAICSIAIIETIVMYYVFGLQIAGDTYGYVKAWNNFSQGNLDYYRTPVYPIVLGISRLLNPSHPYFFVTVIQTSVYLVSVCCFLEISKLYFSNRKIIYFLSALYGIFPVYLSWNITILTESLALSGFVIFLYFFYCTISIGPKSYITLLGTLTTLVLLSFLRPSFMPILGIVLLVWMFQWIRNVSLRKYYAVGIGGLLLSCFCFHLYMDSYNSKYGIYSTSSIGLINQYYMAREGGYLLPEEFKDKEICDSITNACARNDIKNSELLFIESFAIFDKFKYKSGILKEGLDASIQHNPSLYFKGFVKRMKKIVKRYFFNSRILPLSTFFTFFCLDFHMVIFVLMLFLYSIYKHKTPLSTFSKFLFLVPTVTLLMISLGAQSEWSRLFLPVSPSFFLVLGNLYEGIRIE